MKSGVMEDDQRIRSSEGMAVRFSPSRGANCAMRSRSSESCIPFIVPMLGSLFSSLFVLSAGGGGSFYSRHIWRNRHGVRNIGQIVFLDFPIQRTCRFAGPGTLAARFDPGATRRVNPRLRRRHTWNCMVLRRKKKRSLRTKGSLTKLYSC